MQGIIIQFAKIILYRCRIRRKKHRILQGCSVSDFNLVMNGGNAVIDIMIALPIAAGLPILLLMHRMHQMGLPLDRSKAAALTAIGHGSMLLGITAVLLLQILIFAAVIGGIVLYYHWKYRWMYSSDEETTEVMEGISNLPYIFFSLLESVVLF